MKIRTLIAVTIGLRLLASACLQAADTTLFISKPGSKLRIEGTSSVHDWQSETPFIGGSLEVGSDFPKEPGQTVNPGKVNVRVEVFVAVRALKSLEKDGKPYSDAMDERMWEALKAQKHPRIFYRTTELVSKEAPKGKDAPYVFDSTGELIVAGVTNKISMPVNVLPLGEKKLKISGATKFKMTDFKVEPPALTVVGLGIKTGDEVKLSFEWMVAPKTAGPAAAASQ